MFQVLPGDMSTTKRNSFRRQAGGQHLRPLSTTRVAKLIAESQKGMRYFSKSVRSGAPPVISVDVKRQTGVILHP